MRRWRCARAGESAGVAAPAEDLDTPAEEAAEAGVACAAAACVASFTLLLFPLRMRVLAVAPVLHAALRAIRLPAAIMLMLACVWSVGVRVEGVERKE